MCNLLKSSELSDATILLRPSETCPFYASPSLQLYYGLRFALKRGFNVVFSFIHYTQAYAFRETEIQCQHSQPIQI